MLIHSQWSLIQSPNEDTLIGKAGWYLLRKGCLEVMD